MYVWLPQIPLTKLSVSMFVSAPMYVWLWWLYCECKFCDYKWQAADVWVVLFVAIDTDKVPGWTEVWGVA